MTWVVLSGLVGGVGLFLLGMRLMTRGLRLVAGTAFRDILDRWTNSIPRGVLSGALLTGLVQSSSAVTVATIGFVNAGVLTLAQGVGVIYGSNIGTTVTGWLVALVGLDLDIKAFSLPLIGIGMLIQLLRGERMSGRLGEALAGFGILFLGIDVLQAAFEGLQGAVDLSAVSIPGVPDAVVYLGIGSLLTVLMQSSSAALAVTLTAAGGGAISLSAGAAMVIGANMGTTTTAALAVIGATPNAKRIALAHVLFNLLTGAVAFALLPYLLDGLIRARDAFSLPPDPPSVLALFHTSFNLLGVFLMAPLTRPLVRFLQRRFVTQEETESRPRHLDRNVLQVPHLAVRALGLELKRVAGMVHDLAVDSVRGSVSPRRLEAEPVVVDRLLDAVGEFTTAMRRSAMPESVAEATASALRASGYLSEITAHCQVLQRRPTVQLMEALELRAPYEQYETAVLAVLDDGLSSALEAGAPPPVKRHVGKRYEALKVLTLRRAAEVEVGTRRVLGALDDIQTLRRLADRARKCAVYLAPLLGFPSESEPPQAKPAADDAPPAPNDGTPPAEPPAETPTR